jgi:hypothetical protein
MRGQIGEAIGQVLQMEVGVALSPLPIVAVVLMLVTPRGRVNGVTFPFLSIRSRRTRTPARP